MCMRLVGVLGEGQGLWQDAKRRWLEGEHMGFGRGETGRALQGQAGVGKCTVKRMHMF